MMQAERKKRSELTEKNFRSSLPLTAVDRGHSRGCPCEHLFAAHSATPTPTQLAARVPVATPANPAPHANTSVRLSAMLTTLTVMAITMGQNVVCMPMSQPDTAIMSKVAGLSQMQMEK